jgi:hypothetical protein
MVRLNVLLPKYYRTVVESEAGRQQKTGGKMIVYCKIKAPYNTRHNEMKNKESNVIGRDEIAIIFRAKRSECNYSSDETVWESRETPLLIAQVTEFNSEYGCQWPS